MEINSPKKSISTVQERFNELGPSRAVMLLYVADVMRTVMLLYVADVMRTANTVRH